MTLTSPKVLGTVRAVLTGTALAYTRPGSRSAIDKQPREGEVRVDASGLSGDEQGDRRVHGGPDKAVHCYAWTHYPQWRDDIAGSAAGLALLSQAGAFGENLSLDGGLDEHQACIGDRWRIGSAVFEISQGRQPCWKLNDRFGVADMAMRVQRSGRAGWYLRVLQTGAVQAGDRIWLLERPHPEWSVARLLQVIADRRCDAGVLREVLELPLPTSWRKLFSRRLASGEVETWESRMEGPTGQ